MDKMAFQSNRSGQIGIAPNGALGLDRDRMESGRSGALSAERCASARYRSALSQASTLRLRNAAFGRRSLRQSLPKSQVITQ